MQWRCQRRARAVFGLTSLIMLTLLPASNPAIAKEQSAATSLARYEAALHSLETNQLQRFREQAAQLEAFPLYPYLRYAELRHRLRWVSRETVESYLKRYAELPVTPLLRTAWLRELARREDWPAFLASDRKGQNVYVRCARVRAELAVGHEARAIAEAKRLWPVGYRQPQSCNAAFDLLEKAGVLTRERVEERILLALKAGHDRFAVELLERLPASERDKAAHWLNVYRHPETSLEGPPPGSEEMQAQLLLAAFNRVARADPAKAYHLWTRLQAKHRWAETMAGPIQRVIALHAAYQALPSAGEWLRALPETQADARVHAWRARSALRSADWPKVSHAIEAMPAEQRNTAVWRYWQARALKELGQTETAERIYRTIAGRFSYYGFLAADAVATPYHWGAAMPPAEPARKRELGRNADLRRAVLLHRAEQHELAQREWRMLINRLGVRDRVAAARTAEDEGWPWATLYAAATAGVNNASFLRFPLGYLREVRASAGASGIDPEWLLALMRQESAFRSGACSHAGACGLMQLMPATARWVLARQGKKPSDPIATISDPANSIAVGAHYLSYLRKRFSSHVLALAAYNAGPGNVAKWVGTQEPPVGSARWIETLLYGETRRYLKAVLFNSTVYRLRLNNRTVRVAELLRKERAHRERLAMEELAGE